MREGTVCTQEILSPSHPFSIDNLPLSTDVIIDGDTGRARIDQRLDTCMWIDPSRQLHNINGCRSDANGCRSDTNGRRSDTIKWCPDVSHSIVRLIVWSLDSLLWSTICVLLPRALDHVIDGESEQCWRCPPPHNSLLDTTCTCTQHAPAQTTETILQQTFLWLRRSATTCCLGAPWTASAMQPLWPRALWRTTSAASPRGTTR